MKALLICPSDRSGVSHLAESVPLSNVPILGKSLVEFWLDYLVNLGVKEVLILSADRPNLVRNLVADGTRWGLKVEVIPERGEMSITEARAKHVDASSQDWLSEPSDAILMDHLPGLRQHPLFESYAGWFEAVQAFMWRAGTPDRIGVHEIKPGVWVGLRTHISPKAELRAPCWIGTNVWIGPGAVIGPSAMLDDKVFVEGHSEISHSVVAPETFVGELTEVHDSFAWGNVLLNWRVGSITHVPEPFLLCGLAQRESEVKRTNFLARVVAFFILLMTWPVGFAAILRSFWFRHPAFRACRAIYPFGGVEGRPREIIYYELAGAGPWLNRWPQLWKIVRGQFTWVGNRPLTQVQAETLTNDFERLWLAAPIGLFSLADAHGCLNLSSDETRAHASFYAVQHHWRLDVSILAQSVAQAIFGAEPEEKPEVSVTLQPSVIKEKV